jgi:hypothetical protein
MKKLLIGLLAFGSISAFANEVSIKVVHCKGPWADSCRDVTNKSTGKKVAFKLENAGFRISNAASEKLEITLDEGCRSIIDSCQGDSYKETAKATILDANGTVLKTESVRKLSPLFGSSRSLVDELINKL